MTKMVDTVTAARTKEVTKSVTNFMGGVSYDLNPIDTLKMVTASSIFGEPAYYRNGEFDSAKVTDGVYNVNELMKELSVLDDSKYSGKKTSTIMEMVINDALDYDFGATLAWAKTLRTEFNMRLNPQVIMVLAANHANRAKFNEANPGVFKEAQKIVMSRADEPASQLTYQLYKYGKKNNCPNILKRTWAEKLESLSRYQVAKYKNIGLGIIDTVRICHANSPVLDELMKNGTIEVDDSEKTWENLKSEGKTWAEILDTTKLGHMALLKNLRNIFKEINDLDQTKKILNDLVSGVATGKQFPFRYYTAYKMIEKESVLNHQVLILEALENCMDISVENLPKLSGTVACLSDNSGSAWGALTSEYGTVKIAEIGNLSAVITAMRADEGYVGVFGDKLDLIPITKRGGVLAQMKEVTRRGKNIGMGTENGIWLFFDKALRENKHWDSVFIYSDMQAGHGGLYGINEHEYEEFRCHNYGIYIDVMKLVSTYRSKVNAKVNVFSVQTAGYTNVLLPEFAYRANVLYGWTGKEAEFADVMIKFWDSKDAQKELAKNIQK